MLDRLLSILRKLLGLAFFLLVSFVIAAAVLPKMLDAAQQGHYRNLVSAVWKISLSALSQTDLSFAAYSIASPVAAFFITIALLRSLRKEGDVMQQVKESFIAAAVGLLVPLVIMAGTFGWNLVATVYADHENLVANFNRLASSPKVPCPSCPTCPPSKPCKVAGSPNATGTEQGTKEQQQCWMAEIPGGPVTKDSLSSNVAAIHCNYRIEAPWCASATFNKDTFSNGNTFLPGGTVFGGARPGKQGSTFTECHIGPAILPQQLVTVTVYGTEANPPRLLSGWVKSQ